MNHSLGFSSRSLSTWFPYGLLLLLCAAFMARAYLVNDHQVVYPLDDTYIHLSLAKQVGTAGNWGLSPGKFQSSDSSLLYALLLSGCIYLFGPSTWWPLALNLVAGLAFLWALDRRLPQVFPLPWLRAIALGGLLLLLPLHLLVLCGMEHSWQLLISLLFVGTAADLLASPERPHPGKLLLLAVMCTAIRYEGLFLLGGVCLLLAWRRKFLLGLLTFLAGLFPLTLFGVISMQHGAYFLPNSIMAKGHSPLDVSGGFASWIMRGISVIYENPFVWLLLLILGGIAVAMWSKQPLHPPFFSSLVTLMASLVHIFFAEIGGYRYEAYLVMLTLVAGWQALPHLSLPPISRWHPQTASLRLGLVAWVTLLLFPLLIRSLFFTVNYVRSTQNIYQQQIQMARFLATHYPTASVAANDVGAITYFTDIQLLDLAGIGGQEVIPAIRTGRYTSTVVDSLVKEYQVELAVIYDHWVGGRMPSDWTRVARWRIPQNFICAGDTVSFYAPPSNVAELRKRLREFSPQLPEEVEVLEGN